MYFLMQSYQNTKLFSQSDLAHKSISLYGSENWKRNVDKGGVSGALLTDPSKAIECLSNDLPMI